MMGDGRIPAITKGAAKITEMVTAMSNETNIVAITGMVIETNTATIGTIIGTTTGRITTSAMAPVIIPTTVIFSRYMMAVAVTTVVAIGTIIIVGIITVTGTVITKAIITITTAPGSTFRVTAISLTATGIPAIVLTGTLKILRRV